jgi:hypothetical protein
MTCGTSPSSRKAALAKLIRRAKTGLVLHERINEPGDVVFHHACKLGFEGIIDISKRPTLTVKDYALFFDRAKATRAYFAEFYDDWRRSRQDRFCLYCESRGTADAARRRQGQREVQARFAIDDLPPPPAGLSGAQTPGPATALTRNA